MHFIDLKTQQQRIKEKIDSRVQAVLAHGQYIMGPEVRELEGRLAGFVGTKYAVGCASGTDALLLALMAYGIGPGDAVFTTPFTFFATAEMISLLGATPIFVDIDPKTFNLDPAKLELAIQALISKDPAIYPLPRLLSPNSEPRTPNELSATPSALSSLPVTPNAEPRTPNSLGQEVPRPLPLPSSEALLKRSAPSAMSPSTPNAERRTPNAFSLTPRGIIAVDLFGLPADYDSINSIAKQFNLFVIEDAAQSFGAEYNGRKACALSGVACTSFFPAKPLGAYGDGGMCFTDDEHITEVLHSLRVHGQGRDKYENVRIGINGRLDTLQAAILLAKFEIFPEEIELRQQVAQRYTELLSLCSMLHAPCIPEGYKSVWAQYSILAKDETHRSLLLDRLQKASIPTAIYYPKPLHLQGAYAFLGYRAGDFPVSEEMANRIFSLPMHPYLGLEDQERIVKTLESVS